MRQQQKTVEDIYQKMSPIEHILKRPDTYIGSTQRQQEQLWVYQDGEERLQFKNIEFVPGLYKIFDEILVNAADNYQRDQTMNCIKVVIEKENNKISVLNNGKTIPIQIHKEHNIYVPELIFGVLLTGSNYDDSEKRVVGGRNGYGAKLTNVYSKKFIVEVQDGSTQKHYSQTWTNNMSNRSIPEVQTCKSRENFVQITFQPDLARFNMTELEEDIVSLMKKRVYDMAGLFGAKGVKVFLNGDQIKINSFLKYCDMYFPKELNNPIKIYDRDMTTPRWEVMVSYSSTQFQQVSFANCISTSKGGTHVNYCSDKIVTEIMNEVASNKKYKGIEIQKYQIKQSLMIFINCLIDNPSFDSQTKENLTTKVSEFGGEASEKFTVSDKFAKSLLKTDIIEAIVAQAKAKQNAKLNRQLKGTKSAKINGIEKLDDANDAGKKNSEFCTLILTEGDSAKSLVMAAINIIGRDRFGVYPLKGKLLNVRDASSSQILNNNEIQNIIKIVGLQKDKEYTDLKSLRYGSIMFMADQDTDGSHIKGLLLNFIHHFWPSLVKYKGFLTEFVTPIIKVTKARTQQQIQFFTVQDFKVWYERQGIEETKQWTIKYYKGLGTSDDDEAKDYFSHLTKHRLYFQYVDQQDDSSIDLCFNKKKANERKEWLNGYNPNEFVDHNKKDIRYLDFVNKELIHFSMYDNVRSIPNIYDGFKPGQRKVMFCCFKRNLTKELKVVQLGGYVAEHSAYHHGEMSLAETIVGMAQNFPGSNNINLLVPKGQFGSRLQGGKDHASARYIFTHMHKLTRHIFPEPDDHILNYLEDDGHMVEPEFYIPIIPMILVNGAEGIGTGWSTNVPNYNPRDLIAQLRRKLDGEEFQMIHPWYRGWTGEIVQEGQLNVFLFTISSTKGGYTIRGMWDLDEAEEILNIMELPLKKWTKDYKEFLESLLVQEGEKLITDFSEYHTKHKIHFQIQLSENASQRLNVEKSFKLQASLQTTNMVLFDKTGKLKKYGNVVEIMEDYYGIRFNHYELRQDYLASRLEREIQILDNKVRFIIGVIEDEIKLRKVKKQDVFKQLTTMKFTKFSQLVQVKSTKLRAFGQQKPKQKADDDQSGSNNDSQPEEKKQINDDVDILEYTYLLSMPLLSLTYEKVEKLKDEQRKKKKDLVILTSTSVKSIWLEDLQKLEKVLDEFDTEDKHMQEKDAKFAGKGQVLKKKKPKQKKDSNPMTEEKPMKKEKVKDEKVKKENKGASKQIPNKKRKADLSDEDIMESIASIKSLTQAPLRKSKQTNSSCDSQQSDENDPNISNQRQDRQPRVVYKRVVDSESESSFQEKPKRRRGKSSDDDEDYE